MIKILHNKLFQDSFWLLLGSCALRGLVFLFVIYIARILDVNDFGRFSLIRSTSIFMAGILGYFLGVSLTKIIAELIKTKVLTELNNYMETVKAFEILIYLVFMIFLIILYAFNIGAYIFQLDLLFSEYIFIYIIFVLNCNITCNQGILLGFQAVKTLGKSNFISSLVAIPFAIIILYVSQSLYIALIALCVIYFIQALLMSYEKMKLLRQYNLSQRIRLHKKSFLRNIGYSIPLLLMSFTTNASFYFSKIFVLRNSNLGELAIFENSYNWLTVIMLILSTITQPVVGNISGLNNRKEESKYLKQTSFLVLAISCCFSIVIYLLKNQLSLIYAGKYDIHQPLIILTVSSIPLSLFYLYDKVLIAKGRQWICLFAYILYSLLIISLSYFFADTALRLTYCFLISTLISSFVIFILYHFFTKKP